MKLLRIEQARFFLVGGLAAGHYFLLVIFLLHLGLDGALAAILAHPPTFLAAYAGHSRFTFRGTGRHGATVGRYGILQLLCAGAAAISAVVTQRLGVTGPLWIAAITTAALSLVNYRLSSRWVFRP